MCEAGKQGIGGWCSSENPLCHPGDTLSVHVSFLFPVVLFIVTSKSIQFWPGLIAVLLNLFKNTRAKYRLAYEIGGRNADRCWRRNLKYTLDHCLERGRKFMSWGKFMWYFTFHWTKSLSCFSSHRETSRGGGAGPMSSTLSYLWGSVCLRDFFGTVGANIFLSPFSKKKKKSF